LLPIGVGGAFTANSILEASERVAEAL